MRATIQFTLDLAGTSYDMSTTADIPTALSNLSNLIGSLSTYRHQSKADLLRSKMPNEQCRTDAITACVEDIKILETMFRDWYVHGNTNDGHTFDYYSNGSTHHSVFLVDSVEEGEF